MLRILGHSSSACDGLTRRELLQAGAVSLLGLSASRSSATSHAPLVPGKAKAVILLDLFGGPSHIDTFDPKPDAPPEVRGEFAAIPTVLPGIRVCEFLPRLARMLDRTCLIRTVSHGYNSHNPYAVMTGFTGGNDREDYYSKPTNHPSMGSVCQYAGLGRRSDLPGYVVLPAYPGYSDGLRRAGPYGGYLGSQYDPLFSTCDPKWSKPTVGAGDFYDQTLVPMGDPMLPRVSSDLTLDALDQRRSLLDQFEHQAKAMESAKSAAVMSLRQRQALDLLLSPSAKRAFDLQREPPAVRDRYGRDLFGSSVLLARRLVESGVTFVAIHTEAKGNGHWDTHENNFKMLKHWLLPFLDRALSALIEDLEQRGLLESTLVMTNGDMGRTPRVNGKAGRDHWPQCGFCLFAGGGTKAGYVHGSTDKQAAYPKDHPVTPGDLCATVYHLLGVDPEIAVPDQTGRPTPATHGGSPVRAILS
jgi:hypothetical protein